MCTMYDVKKHSQIFKVSPPSRPAHERSCYEVGLRKFPKTTAVRRWYSSFGWNFRHNTTEWTFKNVVLAFQNVLTFENSLWWRLLVNDQKMGSQKLGAYEVRYKWKIQNSITSVNISCARAFEVFLKVSQSRKHRLSGRLGLKTALDLAEAAGCWHRENAAKSSSYSPHKNAG